MISHRATGKESGCVQGVATWAPWVQLDHDPPVAFQRTAGHDRAAAAAAEAEAAAAEAAPEGDAEA